MSFSNGFESPSKWLKRTVSAVCIGGSLLLGQAASATTVQFQTVMGDFEVNLFDKATPQTVANFLAYVNGGSYKNTIMHRSVSGFIVQGGGYAYPDKLPLITIPQKPAVKNEPVYSNLRGTIAMAKLGSDANSATNEWFFNLADNSANLDKQNGGFTVFGQVMGNGMAIIDSMAALNRFTIVGLQNFPLRNYSYDDAKNNVPVAVTNLVLIQNIIVLNGDPDTASSLNPTKNTLITKKDGGGSGSTSLISLLLLGLLALGGKRLLNRK